MRILARTGLIAVGAVVALLLSPASPASAHLVNSTTSETQWYTGGFGNGYYATVVMSSTTQDLTSPNRFNIGGAQSNGGVYYSGPYGNSGVTATSLKHYWTIEVGTTNTQNCSIGYPSGFSCSFSGSTVTATRTTNFGASLPTSTSISQTSFVNTSGGFVYLSIRSEWVSTYKISGVTHERSVATIQRHWT